jgi:cytochrome d ubiquinol oxidase subunit II
MSVAAAVLLLVTVVMYAVFGGADFGAGFWDLVAGSTRRGARPRQLIDQSLAPVWEANHVWLIFTFVVLWTCFPAAYEAITLTMFVPLTIAAFGIVLRGAGFAFRKAVFRTRDQRTFGAAFAISSVLVPYCLGAVLGGIASGRVPSGGQAGDPWHSWVNPTSIVVGVLAVCVAAYLAAVFLVWDARRLSDEDMVAYLRKRASVMAVATGVVGLVGLFVLRSDASYVFAGLTSRALAFLLLSAVAGIGALVLLRWGAHIGARLAAVVAVGSLIIGWAIAQWDYLLPQTLTVSAAAAPSATIATVLAATGLAVLLVMPGLALLYVLDQKSLLPGEGVEEAAGHGP